MTQYRAYAFKALETPYVWLYDQTTYKCFDTLEYAAGGMVASYEIDDDYMVQNNSSLHIARRTNAVPGQVIAVITEEGVKATGVITSVDNEKLQILFKPMLSLFDVDVLNPTRAGDSDSSEVHYAYSSVEDAGNILASYFCTDATDRYRRLPIIVRHSGAGETALWTYKDNTVNLRTWLIDLFDNHNVVLTFNLVFSTSRAYIDVLIAQNSRAGKIIKNNIAGMTIEQVSEGGAKATVCQVINSSTKELLATYYLLKNNTVTTNAAATNRVQPYKLTVVEFDPNNTDGATTATAAEDALLYNAFNHYIRLTIDKNTKMFPELMIGDGVRIVPEIEEVTTRTVIRQNYEDEIFDSIYTGRKESSDNSRITLIFGKIRVNYTDIIQMRQMREVRR